MGRDLEDRIHSCQRKGIDVGAYILGLGSRVKHTWAHVNSCLARGKNIQEVDGHVVEGSRMF